MENVVLEKRVDIAPLTLRESAEALVAQVQASKPVTIKCIFAPESLADKRPITSTFLEGNAFFALIALKESYGCEFHLAGDHIILFTAQ